MELKIKFAEVTHLENVHSIECECSVVFGSIGADVKTVHETGVNGKGMIGSCPYDRAGKGIQLGPRTRSLDIEDSNVSSEIKDQ